MSFKDTHQSQISATHELLFAMAPIEEVIESFNTSARSGNRPGGIQEQDRFANLISSCKEDFPPSPRYQKALISRYVGQIEQDGSSVASDALAEVVFQATLTKDDIFPNPEESSYLSFCIPPASLTKSCSDKKRFLRIRQFPYHNDVSLRLWEAGACLAEYFLENKYRVSRKKVVELGAGVGLTGLVLGGCCGVAGIHVTDYTDEALLNLEHNITVNKEWLSASGRKCSVTQGYLEWSDFIKKVNDAKCSPTNTFTEADVLIAADVIYDVSVIDYLVAIIQNFLSVDRQEKEVILGVTQRNLATFNTFLETLRNYNISSEWIADGNDCNNLPRIFNCKFNQSRSDVRIASLKLIS
eukprot:scaffold2047_cov129-Cylindrotheca_fusiformis.AAC.48